jgi:4-amino-4-deoxy-L-arabinose transferase-like glycosyltransferase
MKELGQRLLARPGAAVALLCLVQIVAWTLAPSLSHDAPPLDVAEGYMWGPERVIATYKHPALPSVLLEASRRLTGAVGWPAYLLSQLAIAATFACVYLLGRDVLGPARALAGTLLLTAVFYFSWPTPEFNHNVAQMPAWAAIALLLWRAIERGGLLWWLALGIAAAAGMYAKLSTGLFLAVCGLWVLYDTEARRSIWTIGPWLALAVFAALLVPVANWLAANDFLLLTYAAERGAVFGRFALFFIVEQALALAGLGVVLALGGLAIRPMLPTGARERRFAVYLAMLTVLPILATVLSSLVSGIGVKGMWGAPMLSLVGLLAVVLAGDRLDARARGRIGAAAAILVSLLPVAYALSMTLAPVVSKPRRQNWPQAEIASRMRAVWREATGKPLTIVAGDPTNWVPGMIGVAGGPMPSLFTNGDMRLSPWVTEDRLAREGALVAWQELGTGPPAVLKPLIGGRPIATEHFAWPRKPGAAPLVIGYVILAPR